MKGYSRGLFLWVFLALVVMLAFTMVGQDSRGKPEEIQFSQLIQQVRQSNVKDITIKGQELTGTLADSSRFRTIGPADSDYFLDVLAENEIVPNYEPEPDGGTPDAGDDDPHLLRLHGHDLEGIDQRRQDDHGRTVLIVVEHGDVQACFQALLDLEAAGS